MRSDTCDLTVVQKIVLSGTSGRNTGAASHAKLTVWANPTRQGTVVPAIAARHRPGAGLSELARPSAPMAPTPGCRRDRAGHTQWVW